MNLSLDILLTGDETFKPWVAMRIDVLPWFNHKFVRSRSTQDRPERATPSPKADDANNDDDDDVSVLSDSTGGEADEDTRPSPSFKIDKLSVKAFADEIKWGLWHGIYDTDGLCIVIPRVNVLSMSERLKEEEGGGKLVSNSTQIDLGSVKATLLDIVHCYEWELSPSEASKDLKSSSDTEMFNLLQKWHSQITEMDYIVEANNVIILDHAVDDDDKGGTFGSVHEFTKVRVGKNQSTPVKEVIRKSRRI